MSRPIICFSEDNHNLKNVACICFGLLMCIKLWISKKVRTFLYLHLVYNNSHVYLMAKLEHILGRKQMKNNDKTMSMIALNSFEYTLSVKNFNQLHQAPQMYYIFRLLFIVRLKNFIRCDLVYFYLQICQQK